MECKDIAAEGISLSWLTLEVPQNPEPHAIAAKDFDRTRQKPLHKGLYRR